MWERGLLKEPGERGSAVVESIFGIFVLLMLSLGAIQVALTLYARNVVMAALHDGARAAIEMGGSIQGAEIVAQRVVLQSAGGLVDDLAIDVRAASSSERYSVTVRATGTLVAPGPVPVDLPLDATATATREDLDVASR